MATVRAMLVKRSINAVITIFGIIVVNFLLLRLVPAIAGIGFDPAIILAPRAPNFPPGLVEQNREIFGLNDPWQVQFWKYLQGLFTGNWGFSYKYLKPVLDVIIGSLMWTLLLVGVSTAITIVLGIVVGAYAAARRGKLFDLVSTNLGIFFWGMPLFWLGLLLMIGFGERSPLREGFLLDLSWADALWKPMLGPAQWGPLILSISWEFVFLLLTALFLALMVLSQFFYEPEPDEEELLATAARHSTGVKDDESVLSDSSQQASGNALVNGLNAVGVRLGRRYKMWRNAFILFMVLSTLTLLVILPNALFSQSKWEVRGVFWWPVFPSQLYYDYSNLGTQIRFEGPFISSILMHMVLPVLTLVIGTFLGVSLVMRNSLIDTMTEDFIVTARAKGLSRREILRRHALPNGMPPMVTLIALDVAFILGGAYQVEVVFSYEGIGYRTIEAISVSDWPILQFILIVGGIAVVLANLIADFIIIRLDPRIKIA